MQTMINCVCDIHHCCKSHSNMVNQHVATWLISYSKKWVCGCLCTCIIVNSSVVLMIVVKDADIFSCLHCLTGRYLVLVSLRCVFFNFFSRGQTGSSKQGFQAGPRKNGVKSAQPHNPSVLLTLCWKNISCCKSRSKGSIHHFFSFKPSSF